MKKQKLEDYVRTYLNDRAADLGADGYTRWLAENTNDLSAKRTEAISAADTSYKKSLSDYGTQAQSLLSSGLSKSGYADYLDTRAKFSYDDEVKDINERYATDTEKSIEGYSKYLDGVKKERDELIEDTTRSIIKAGVMDYNTAFLTGIEAGLGDELARKVAQDTTERVRTEYRRNVITTALNKNLSREQAEEYARSLGLIEADVKRIGETAYMLNQLPHLDSSTMNTYINYLKDIGKIKK